MPSDAHPTPPHPTPIPRVTPLTRPTPSAPTLCHAAELPAAGRSRAHAGGHHQHHPPGKAALVLWRRSTLPASNAPVCATHSPPQSAPIAPCSIPRAGKQPALIHTACRHAPSQLPPPPTHTQALTHPHTSPPPPAQVFVQYSSNPPEGLEEGSVVGSCNASSADAVSGVGDCAIVLDARYFPASGVAGANVTVRVQQGWVAAGVATRGICSASPQQLLCSCSPALPDTQLMAPSMHSLAFPPLGLARCPSLHGPGPPRPPPPGAPRAGRGKGPRPPLAPPPCLHRSVLLTASDAAPLEVHAPPTSAPFSPAAPGMRVLMPYRPVDVGETIKARRRCSRLLSLLLPLPLRLPCYCSRRLFTGQVVTMQQVRW